jgi:hypothetical protein
MTFADHEKTRSHMIPFPSLTSGIPWSFGIEVGDAAAARNWACWGFEKMLTAAFFVTVAVIINVGSKHSRRSARALFFLLLRLQRRNDCRQRRHHQRRRGIVVLRRQCVPDDRGRSFSPPTTPIDNRIPEPPSCSRSRRFDRGQYIVPFEGTFHQSDRASGTDKGWYWLLVIGDLQL